MTKVPAILIIDDEKDICEILQFNLEAEGFITEVCHSAEEALKKSLSGFDLILLDIMMGNISGYKMAEMVRKEHKLDIPIIFLTAKTSENNILTGFTVGGDDYITKPFSVREVIARVKAVLKRGKSTEGSDQVISSGKLLIDIKSKTVTLDDKLIDLTRKEFEILSMLVKYPGQYFNRTQILEKVWADDVIVTERNVDVNITRLRKKIGEHGNFIKGKSGFGYCYDPS